MRPPIEMPESPQDAAKKALANESDVVLATSLPNWDLLPPPGMTVRRKKISGE